ncbi:Zn-ribbon domain-containing OB-fold protein [Nocardiopsis quinghaiensis]|uniref:Zn-ribbon domain-containing OB-fold protein n=1 Tax=Nocardiopsis quinghaiensis TaxID=464995 RepID=UPI00123972A4
MKPVASPTPDTQEWFDRIDVGELTVAHCQNCALRFLYPRMCCPGCGSRAVGLIPVSGRGSVASWVVNHRGPGVFAEEAPYVIALVRLEEGPMLMSNILVEDPNAVSAGLPVRAEFEQRGERRVVQFVPEVGTV